MKRSVCALLLVAMFTLTGAGSVLAHEKPWAHTHMHMNAGPHVQLLGASAMLALGPVGVIPGALADMFGWGPSLSLTEPHQGIKSDRRGVSQSMTDISLNIGKTLLATTVFW